MKKKLEHAYEQLEAIDKAEGKEKVELLTKYGTVAPLSHLLSLNFNPKHVLDLPEGMAPFERDEATNVDFMGKLVTEIKRLRVCFKGTNYKKKDRERVFIQVCESIPVKEAELLCFVKDKSLTELYPTVTAELVESVFPSYIGK